METNQLLQQILDTATRIEARQASTDAAVARIEAKQSTLIEALAEDEEAPPTMTLDGAPAGREREQGQSLG